MIARVTAVAAAEGLDFQLDRAVRANTADAHRLLWWALRTAGPATQVTLNEQLMAAYFTDGEDLGDPRGARRPRRAVWARPARPCGEALADEDGVEALAVALRNATELGITAVPTFVVNSRWSIPGAQDPEYFVQVLRRMAAP